MKAGDKIRMVAGLPVGTEGTLLYAAPDGIWAEIEFAPNDIRSFAACNFVLVLPDGTTQLPEDSPHLTVAQVKRAVTAALLAAELNLGTLTESDFLSIIELCLKEPS